MPSARQYGCAFICESECPIPTRRSSSGILVPWNIFPLCKRTPAQIFLELATVKRVGLASAMCSPEDRLALKDVSDHVRRHLVGRSGGELGGASGGGRREKEEQVAGRGGRLPALEAAVSTLGLQP